VIIDQAGRPMTVEWSFQTRHRIQRRIRWCRHWW